MEQLHRLFRSFIPLLIAISCCLPAQSPGNTKTETFDSDPGWEGVHNRSAREVEPITVRQDYGYSSTNHAGGTKTGEIGGYVSAAGEPTYYARSIPVSTFDNKLSASGILAVGDGETHVLLGFFNSENVNEWRTPNTIAIRILGRGNHYFAFVEYCTSKWRAGGDNPQAFPMKKDAEGRNLLIGFPSGRKSHRWSLHYDPDGNGGKGTVTATIDDNTAICNLDDGHKPDGATFNRFGVLGANKSVDHGSEIFFDDITVNGETDHFDQDPKWTELNNRRTYPTRNIRPRYDFGFADSHRAGGKNAGEIGGQLFRGDCRQADRMACYGDRIGPLSLDKPLKASGKVVMTRGVTDSTTLFGFYHSKASMRQDPAYKYAVPESTLGIFIEGPSAEGFLFYPVCRVKGGEDLFRYQGSPHIYPDAASHDWTLEYDPEAAEGKGRITVSLDGKKMSLDLPDGQKKSGTEFDRFGIITTWHDGNGQSVYWDDLTYTIDQSSAESR